VMSTLLAQYLKLYSNALLLNTGDEVGKAS
jgi:hypothetical protein